MRLRPRRAHRPTTWTRIAAAKGRIRAATGGPPRAIWTLRSRDAACPDNLAATRDPLLPQLMSGKLRVRDAEKVVEAVV